MGKRVNSTNLQTSNPAYTTREMNRRQLLGRFLIRMIMTHEEKQIHNAVHAELREFEEFKELVRRMRKAQDAFNISVSADNIEDIDFWHIRMLDLEREVDEYLKKMEICD